MGKFKIYYTLLEDKNKYGPENIIVVLDLNLSILEMQMDSAAVE